MPGITATSGALSPSPQMPPASSRSPFQRLAGSLRRSRSSGALKDINPPPNTPLAPSSPPLSSQPGMTASPRRRHVATPSSPSKASYAPARPSPLMSSALLSFGSVSEAEGESSGTGYPWDHRPVTPKDGSFGTLQSKLPSKIETRTVQGTRRGKSTGLARVVSGSVSEFGERPDGCGGGNMARDGGSSSRTMGGTHGRSRSLFALSKKGRSSPAPPTPTTPSVAPSATGAFPASRKSLDSRTLDGPESAGEDAPSRRPRTLSKARRVTASSGSLSRPTSPKVQTLRSPSSPLSPTSRPTTPKSLNAPSFLASPSVTPSPSSPTLSSSSRTYSSRPSTMASSIPTSPASSITPSRSTSSIGGAFKTLRRKSSAAFGLGGGESGSVFKFLPTEDHTATPKSPTEPRRSTSSRPSATSPRPSTATETPSRLSFSGLSPASPLASPSSVSLATGDPFLETTSSSSKLRKQSKSIGSMGAFRSLRRTTGRVGSVGAMASTSDLATYPTGRKSEGGAPFKPQLSDSSSTPLPITSPRTSSQLNERPRLSSPSRSSLLLQQTPTKPSAFRSLRKKTSQVFRSSPDLSLRHQHPTNHEHEPLPRSQSHLIHHNHRANKSTTSLGLMGDGFKLKLGAFGSSGKGGDDDEDAKEFGAGFKEYEDKAGAPVDSYRSGKGVFTNRKLDTKMNAEDEQLVSGVEGANLRKRKTFGSVLVGLFKPLSPRRSVSHAGIQGSTARGGAVFPEYSGISIQVSTDRVVTSQ
ncbi:hypothetical protein BKA70DRAFT_726585 [Coprinopsis sp. MPI-PUGE-AT-0042]|nr:hypothetical protein BKA70DRAFT_726585 [Coprinopsis sp. MPI-PUGE-AT-0042]